MIIVSQIIHHHNIISFERQDHSTLSISLTLLRLSVILGKTSSTVLSTSTPPIKRNALRLGSSGLSVSSTNLECKKRWRKKES